jgi:hypothetical protein
MRILRGLTGRTLSCGCVAGSYETYEGEVVWILDERGPTCENGSHEAGQPLVDAPDEPTSDPQP